jgi:probable F420-dependent oxidoreductase
MPVLDLAREAEARGFHSISLPEHTHVPVGSQQTSNGWTMPDRYKRVLDPYIASAFVAALTGLEVGTAVSLVAQHDAIALAKAIATLDHLSEGRMLLGVGFGYNRPEAADHGFPVRERAVVVEETVRLMRALWSEDEAEYEGQYRRVSKSWAWPKPFRPGGPPVLLGVRATPRNFDRIVAWADGWIPMGTGPANASFEGDLSELRARWRDGDRPGAPELCCFFQPGSAADMAHQIERGAELSVQRMQVFLEDRGREDVLPVLDTIAQVIG